MGYHRYVLALSICCDHLELQRPDRLKVAMGNCLSWLLQPQDLPSFYPSCPTTAKLETMLVISVSAQDKVVQNTQHSAKGVPN